MFKKAERKQIKLKLAITGPSGSGKTYSALALAQGLGKKIAVIDTENGSASLYSEHFEFDVLELEAPFNTEKYIQAIKYAEVAGYDVLVIDSITHAWSGEGGLLQQKESIDARGGNSYTNWATVTKKHEIFKSAFLNTNMHIICTMRSKQDYVIEQNEKGKSAPKKVGLAPIQREGMEYEFTTVFDIAMNHEAIASKDRTGLFTDQMFKVTKEIGEKISKWLEGGAPVKHYSYDEVYEHMKEAKIMLSLDNAADMAKTLVGKDRDEIRDYYKLRREEIRNSNNPAS